MSELINNREYRQKKLKELIRRLHDGATVDEVKADFDQLTKGIRAIEITEMEQALVNEGMEVAEIQRLCDVHASVFKGSIEEIHASEGNEKEDFEEGHPIHTLKKENRKIEKHMEDKLLRYCKEYVEQPSIEREANLIDSLQKLETIDRHYARKENLIFPYMEKYNITAPPQVMWGVDDEIREKIKKAIALLKNEKPAIMDVEKQVKELVKQVKEMIFKEEEIMIPMLLDALSKEEWVSIESASTEIGYTFLQTVKRWKPKKENNVVNKQEGDTVLDKKVLSDRILFDAGSLTQEEINAILNTVPLDMTFVGADNRVKYFTQGKERVFDRPLTIIGREVKNCHPPKSVHIVEQIVEDLRNGVKDTEDFWIRMGEKFVYIRYLAVRNKEGQFLGTLEVTQNIKPITELEGEKRLRDAE